MRVRLGAGARFELRPGLRPPRTARPVGLPNLSHDVSDQRTFASTEVRYSASPPSQAQSGKHIIERMGALGDVDRISAAAPIEISTKPR